MIDTTTPPPRFKSTPVGLRVCFHNEVFLIYDNEGFLCTCSSIKSLEEVLRMEAEGTAQHPEKGPLKWYWAGAREKLFPGSALAFTQRMGRKFAPEKDVAVAAADLLADLGL